MEDEKNGNEQQEEQQEQQQSTDAGDEGKETTKTYTDEEVNAIVEKRLARERAKIEKAAREQAEKDAKSEEDEAERLKGMTELQKAQYEAKKLKEENDALKSEQNLSKQMAVARKELSEAGISLGDELLSIFVSPEAEKTNEALESIKKLWPEALNKAVQDALKRTPPPAEKKSGETSFGATYAKNYSEKMNGGKKNAV